MSDLHSIAYSSSFHTPSLGWELQNLGVFNADNSHLMMENTPPFFSPLEADYSTGYLQDALFEFSSKRRRLLLFSDQDQTNNSMENCWNSNLVQNSYESYEALSPMSKSCDSTNPGMSEDASLFTDMKTSQEAISAFETYDSSSSISSLNARPISDKQTLYSLQPLFSSGAGGEKRLKKRAIQDKVVYPFDFIKPGGLEGDVTLDDINERILMPPSRPVRHPVGDFACRPLVSSADGPGLSGKAVVALTRIHTHGRGTITIIRTRD